MPPLLYPYNYTMNIIELILQNKYIILEIMLGIEKQLFYICPNIKKAEFSGCKPIMKIPAFQIC